MTSRTTDLLARGWQEAIAAAPDWQPPICSTLVVVPHPDDESLSTGGLIVFLRRRGAQVALLAVTDGEAAYPNAVHPEQLKQLRRSEQDSAASELELPCSSITRASIADGGVASAERALEQRIVRMVEHGRIDHVVAPWIHDDHPDHEACGRAATAAAAITGTPVTYGIFWGLQRTADPSFGAGRLVRFHLDATDHDAKQRAIGRHRSQFTTDIAPVPILGPEDLEPTTWKDELFVVNAGGA